MSKETPPVPDRLRKFVEEIPNRESERIENPKIEPWQTDPSVPAEKKQGEAVPSETKQG